MFVRLVFKDFRGFERLELDGLQRVNLVVGKNNAGKTSLLEGIAICVEPKQITETASLFRPQVRGAPTLFGQVNVKENASRWLIRDPSSDGMAKLSCEGSTNFSTAICRERNSDFIVQGCHNPVSLRTLQVYVPPNQPDGVIPFRVVAAHHRDPDSLVKSFGKAVRQRSGEEKLESVLQSVDSRIQKLRVDPGEDGNQIVVDIGLSELVPLSQIGQGIFRLVSIFSELIGEQARLCFIDEIENGLHHSVLETVWRGVAEVAEKMDIQVFASTHSFECIQAAHSAFSARPNYDFSIIQLFRVDSATQGRVLGRQDIEAALAGEIDLRGL